MSPDQHILAFDDDLLIQQAYGLLFGAKYRLTLEKDLANAEALIRKIQPDLILLDDIMPGGPTGLSFLDTLRSDPFLSTIPVVMVTASNKEEEIMRGLKAGATEYITKPFKPGKLVDVVEAILKRRPPIIVFDRPLETFSQDLIDRLSSLGCKIKSVTTDETPPFPSPCIYLQSTNKPIPSTCKTGISITDDPPDNEIIQRIGVALANLRKQAVF